MSRDKYTDYLLEELAKVNTGFIALGIEPRLLPEVSVRLRELSALVEKYEASNSYIKGRKDGWDCAFATGIIGNK